VIDPRLGEFSIIGWLLTFFPTLKLYINFDINCVGLHCCRFVNKLIWPPRWHQSHLHMTSLTEQ
jgi:hypothetical protein